MNLTRRSGLVWVLPTCLALACSGGTSLPPAHPGDLQSIPITQTELRHQEFAPRVAELLRDGTPSPKRMNHLVAVVRHQLRRAQSYFDSGREQAAVAAVMGAMYLVRAGEFRQEMMVGVERTLLDAAASVSRSGDEGRAEAFYAMVLPRLAESAERRETLQHLDALKAWQAQTRAGGSMQAAGDRRLAAAKRSLVWPTPENLGEAHESLADWVERAFVVGREQGPLEDANQFDERSEAHRAVMLGAASVVALYLRDGDALGALRALDAEPFVAVANTRLISRIGDAADGNPDAWSDMFGFFGAPNASAGATLDGDLARGAAWGSAVELYRLEPSDLRGVSPLATLLVEHGMADVAPLLFDGALGDKPEPEQLSAVLRLLTHAMFLAEQNADLPLARQIFENGKRLLTLAASARYQLRVRPGAPDVRYAMGAMESRAGELARARPHLQAAASANPSPASLRLLAAIDRQRGDLAMAIDSLTRMQKLAQAQGDAASEAATLVMIYDLSSELRRPDEASMSLTRALELVLVARSRARTGPEVAAIERVLADVLERYGDREGANRAVERAVDAARNDLGQLTATTLDAARRALVLGDLEAGRRAMRNALDANLDPEDLVYAALWVKLLHQRAGASSDGSYEAGLARVDGGDPWIGALRDWGRGALSGQQLVSRATNVVERVEAEFYVAISEHLSQPTPNTIEQLNAVANSPAIELVEVRVARDFVRNSEGLPTPTLPPNVVVP